MGAIRFDSRKEARRYETLLEYMRLGLICDLRLQVDFTLREACTNTQGDRLAFREFKNDDFDLNTIFAMNNGDILPDNAVLSALISSCCFIYISEDETGYPRLQVIDGANVTGVKDPITGMLKEGYAVITRDKYGNPEMEAYFLPGRTEYYQGGQCVRVDSNPALYPLLVPIIYRADAQRPFGHSRISRACMSLQQGAMRTLLRSESIKASHENLRLAARKAQRTFGSGFLNAGYLAACVRDEFPYQRRQLYETKLAWEPVFEPDAAMLSSIGDGVGKINQAVPGYFGKGNLRDMTGVEPDA